MAVSGTISATTFNTLKVVDHAFRRCRLNAQNITAEMHSYATDSLYLILSDLANIKTPSWCIDKVIMPMYLNQPEVNLPVGTVEVLNANYRSMQEVTGETVSLSTSYTVLFSGGDYSDSTVSTVGVKWSGDAVPLTFQVTDDNVTWTTVGTQTTIAAAGEWTWTDVSAAVPHLGFRITASAPILASEVFLGNTPQEIPLGSLNRDTYVAQSNKVFAGRPSTYWFQRYRPQPLLNLWPAPNEMEEHAQLVVWRHRHIMDVGSLQQEVEVPQRWLEAIVAGLAAKVAAESPVVDVNLIQILDAKAAAALNQAWTGDNDGSPTFIQPRISAYTR